MSNRFIDYNSITTGIIKFLNANSLTINTSLASSISTIFSFDPSTYPYNESQFPALSVNLISAEEETIDIGYQGANIRCVFEIGCHTKNLESLSITEREVRSIVSNVQHAIRHDVTISGTFSEGIITGAEFRPVINEEGVYQKNAIVNFEAVLFAT